MTRLFLDCEFNGLHGELISMALVSDDHAEWYQTVATRGRIDPWVVEHVIPYLSATFTSYTRERSDHEDLAASLDAFLSNFDNPEIIADWPADFEHFGNLLTIIGANGGFKEAYACTMKLINVPGQLKPEVPHNALSDARALRDWYMASMTEGFIAEKRAMRLALNSETGTQNETSAKTYDDRLHNDCDGGQCVACHEDQKNA
jgi:hypothetical protein